MGKWFHETELRGALTLSKTLYSNQLWTDLFLTFRYEECQKLYQGRQSVLQWKAEICLQDLDFKGYYHLTCTEKCRIDFHPWCWKHKKDQEVKKDKDYLQEWCLTPDCKAPFCKITVVKGQLISKSPFWYLQIDRKNRNFCKDFCPSPRRAPE